MPIRIYDIAKSLNIESRYVLAKARELGIAAAKVPSSQIDKITGEYLLNQMRKSLPVESSRPPNPIAGRGPMTPSVTPPVYLPATPRQESPESNPTLGLRLSDQKQNTAAKEAVAPAASPSSETQRLPQSSNPGAAAQAKPQFSAQPSGPMEKITAAISSHLPTSEAPSVAFEREVRRILDQRFPNCTLSNVLIFRPDKARFSTEPLGGTGAPDYGHEVDHMLHRASSVKDNLIIIECKNQEIKIEDEDTWTAEYADGPKNVLLQMKRQAETLRAYANPMSRGRELEVNVILVSSRRGTKFASRSAEPWVTFILCSIDFFRAALNHFNPPPIRIAQSDVLNLFRMGVPTPELGHPELNNALAYVERCRRSIDAELFRAFSPTQGWWAINGSAGMGKSVLLAFSLFVFSSNRQLKVLDGKKQLIDFSGMAGSIGLPPHDRRRVYAFALKEKQRIVLAQLYRRFVEEFSLLSTESDLGIRRPCIELWNGLIPADCNVLIIDEAHDLSATDAATVASWIGVQGARRYLLIACDRHQKLRLVGRDEAIIDGINFSRRTKKLRLNYRNSFPVYGASLGMMFRWFCPTGPRVVPSKDDLENGFGLSVDDRATSDSLRLSMRNDAHPANAWAHCVELFSQPEGALARLRPFRFRPQDVLWIRFSGEDEHFDYEQLSCFTYHNLNCHESVDLADKYIKGQDFPIVVIEGISDDMNRWGSPEAEEQMWRRRRELYICASRATAFLFLVARGSDAWQEFEEIVRQLSAPARGADGFQRLWSFDLMQPADGDRRRLDVFTDAREV